jgi:hypothetical protein
MMGEVHTCPNCGRETHICDDRAGHQLDNETTMSWIAAEPLY